MRLITRHSLTISLALFCLGLLLSCGRSGDGNGSLSNAISHTAVEGTHSNADTGLQNQLVGTWVHGGYCLIFSLDNSYSRSLRRDNISIVLGSITISGDLVIVTDNAGYPYSCRNSSTEQAIIGSYTYSISGNTLIFHLFQDSCSDRVPFFNLVYTRQ